MNKSTIFKICLVPLIVITINLKTTLFSQNVIISEISLCINQVELHNVGNSIVDLTTWWFCNSFPPLGTPVHTTIASLSASPSTLLFPGGFVAITWSGISGPTGELALFDNSGFFNSNSIHDYVLYNTNTSLGGLAALAVSAGVWNNANAFVTIDASNNCMTSIANASSRFSSNSTTWCTSSSNTLGSSNSACMNTSSPCPDDYANGGLANSSPTLTGIQNSSADFETDGIIISSQTITSAVTVDYDSGTSINLETGFEVKSASVFHSFIDGCGGTQ